MITTLVENLVYSSGLSAEHGLSLYIEFNDVRILFDTGQTADCLLNNATKLGVDLALVDHCVISHGHYDHTGGLAAFRQINPDCTLWINKQAAWPRYSLKGDYIGMGQPELADQANSVAQVTEIASGIFILPAGPLQYPDDQHMSGFFMQKDGQRQPDDFMDEQSLVLVRDGAMQIISGCSHRGITNIIQYAIDSFNLPVELVVGGFHLRHDKDISATATRLDSFGIRRLGVSHCTGVEKYVELRGILNSHVFYNHTGHKTELFKDH